MRELAYLTLTGFGILDPSCLIIRHRRTIAFVLVMQAFGFRGYLALCSVIYLPKRNLVFSMSTVS